jgi:DNA polymerase
VAASPPDQHAAQPRDLTALAEQARGCRACELWEHATQTVFGAGPRDAAMMAVGEQPGDVEDRRGEPFVGPAGSLLVRALQDAGVDPSRVYRTNAVKHFRFRQSAPGARRIHQTPELSHLVACQPWLSAELAAVRAPVLLVLGATAARVLLGPSFRVTASRGTPLAWPDVAAPAMAEIPTAVAQVVATVHPSAVLRAADREIAYRAFVDDLRVAAACRPGPPA